jgi:large subunit ribosomal protein L10
VPLTLEQKQAVVTEVNAVAAKAHSAVAAEYRGITVTQMTELRKNARSSGVYLRVVKNTLAGRALAGTDFECLKPGLKGPLLLAFSSEEPGAAARLLKDFAKGNEKLVVTALAVGGRLLPASEIDRLASMPTRPQALSLLLGALQAPLTKLARTLAEPTAKLVRTFAAVRDQKQAG